MRILTTNWRPSPRVLRQFAVIAMFMLPLVGWSWNANAMWLGLLAGIGAALVVASIWAPGIVRPVYLAMLLIAFPFGLIIGELAVLTIFYGVVLPIGLLLRLLGRDALELHVDRTTPSYWKKKAGPKNAASYFRQS